MLKASEYWAEREKKVWRIAAELELDNHLELLIDMGAIDGKSFLLELYDYGEHEATDCEIREAIKESNDIGVYLHWNGGRDSFEAFLTYCKLKGYREPETDNYGWARLCQVIGNFFGGTDSLGIGSCCELDCDNWDNGVYVIRNWEIVDRKYFSGVEQRAYDLKEMLLEIDGCQPEKEQLGEDKIAQYFTEGGK